MFAVKEMPLCVGPMWKLCNAAVQQIAWVFQSNPTPHARSPEPQENQGAATGSIFCVCQLWRSTEQRWGNRIGRSQVRKAVSGVPVAHTRVHQHLGGHYLLQGQGKGEAGMSTERMKDPSTTLVLSVDCTGGLGSQWAPGVEGSSALPSA